MSKWRKQEAKVYSTNTIIQMSENTGYNRHTSLFISRLGTKLMFFVISITYFRVSVNCK
jgi:hypothetical protein